MRHSFPHLKIYFFPFPAMIDEVNNGNFPNEKALTCYVYCMMEAFSIVSEFSQYRLNVYLAFLYENFLHRWTKTELSSSTFCWVYCRKICKDQPRMSLPLAQVNVSKKINFLFAFATNLRKNIFFSWCWSLRKNLQHCQVHPIHASRCKLKIQKRCL